MEDLLPKEIKPCKQRYSSYYNDNNLLELKKLLENCETDLAENVKLHEENLPKLEHNKDVKKSIIQFMESHGVYKTFKVYDIPTPRSTNKKWLTKNAGYLSDLDRLFIISDNFETVKSNYEREIQSIKEKIRMLTNKKELEDRLLKQELENNKNKKVLLAKYFKLLEKYGIEDSNYDVSEFLELLLGKSKYLRLADAMSDCRGDFSLYYLVENALCLLDDENELDKQISEDISYYLNPYEGDGRVFRDCEYSYTVLYDMVDKDLLEDYNFIIHNSSKLRDI